jgi:Winged helix DNA-binding domain
MDRLAPRLRTFQDERGKELVDIPNGPRPDPDTLAEPRFLPGFDNALLSHADRTRIVSDDHRKRLLEGNQVGLGTVLVDGFVRATWRIVRAGDAATLLFRPLDPLNGSARNAVSEEGRRLLAFAAADVSAHDVQFR